MHVTLLQKLLPYIDFVKGGCVDSGVRSSEASKALDRGVVEAFSILIDVFS